VATRGTQISACNGIALSNPNKEMLILGNHISSLTGASTNGMYGYYGVQTGCIDSNVVTGATNGYRFDISAPGLLFGHNNAATKVENAIVGNCNVTLAPCH
jgi:hypothetical protein